MHSKQANLALLLGLSFLWFFLGIGATVTFSFALGGYGEAGEGTTPLMIASLVTLLALPLVCAHTLVHGWRRFLAGDYPSIIRVVLLPFPVLAITVVLSNWAWD